MQKMRNLLNITEKFNDFIGFSLEEISNIVSINPELLSKKASIVSIVNRMFEYKNINKKILTYEMQPMQISIKTIRLQHNGKPRESMSFENVNFLEMISEEWRTSKLRRKFADTIFLFVVFQYTKTENDSALLFKGVKIWKMPEENLDVDLKKLWDTTRELVTNRLELKKKVIGNRVVIENNLPGKSNNDVAHIRPKAADGNDKVELPDGQMITKQAYWLNNDYIGLILSEMPDVYRKKPSNLLNCSRFSTEEVKRLKNKFDNQVYPLEEFIIKAKQEISNFTEMDIRSDLVSLIGYKLDNRFIISEQLESIDQYLDSLIYSGSYFQVPQNPLFVTPFVKRKISKYENDYKLLKIEDNYFITNKSLINGGITKKDIINYKEAVERFVEDGHFFTLRYLEDSYFTHELIEYGFEDIFYQSILMRPGRLRFIKLANQIIFVKSKKNVTTDDFIQYLLAGSESIGVDDLIERGKSMCCLILDYTLAIQIMKNTSYFFSPDLLKLYEDKEYYYKEIYE